MKTNLSILVACSILTFMGCFSATPLYTPYSSLDYKGKYAEFLKADEDEVHSWYYYVITKNKKGKYIKRTFYPETRTLTSKVICNDPIGLIANGKAQLWWDNGKLRGSGTYKQNKKEGRWHYYNFNGNLLKAGNYSYNKRKGIWTLFDEKGHIIEKVNYKNDKKNGVFSQFDTLGNVINEGIYKDDNIIKQTSINKVERISPYLSSCEFIPNLDEKLECSKIELSQYISRNLKYPERAIRYKIQGTALTSFYINEDGTISDINVLMGLNDDIKKECIRLVNKLPKIISGRINGKNEKMQMLVELKFNPPISYYDY